MYFQLSLRHRSSTDISRNIGASNKKVFFPVVTPGSAGGSASLSEDFPEGSLSLDITDATITSWSAIDYTDFDDR